MQNVRSNGKRKGSDKRRTFGVKIEQTKWAQFETTTNKQIPNEFEERKEKSLKTN